MIENTLDLQVSADGLTYKEMREFQSILRASTGVVHVGHATSFLSDFQPRRLQASAAPEFHLLVTFALHAAELGVGLLATDVIRPSSKKCGELIAERFEAWWREKFDGKSSVSVEVTIYGSDDQPVRVVKAKR